MKTTDKQQILVADDDPDILRAAIRYFEESAEKYEILRAPNGFIACEVARKVLPALIILDWEMPVMNGPDALTVLKSDDTTRDIPVIIATGHMTDDKHLAEALAAGAADYIRKPFTKIELLARVKSALSLAESYRELVSNKLKIKELHNREKDLLRSLVERKARELTTLTSELVRKNELLESLAGYLEKTPGALTPEIRKIIRLTQENKNTDQYWDTFKQHFEEVHPDFFENLRQKCPKISQNELRIAAYVRMNLSNKEIARLLNLSSKGMETARYRLKKKLELAENQNLNDFILNN